jgi:gliding motility-associated-like protein
MRRIILPCFFILQTAALWAQPCGLEDTLYILSNSQHVFDFEVYNIYNDDLSDPAQGICGVELFFAHNLVNRLEITLVSPGGQAVQLIGPNANNQFPLTNFARWQLLFVPCSGTPSPVFGTLPQWDNAGPNPWAVGGNYNGSYYPYLGCLEDFDQGPVNGTWQIQVANLPSPNIGAILGFRILFCDERGLNCCFAASGDLDIYDDILACESDSSLLLDLPPNFTGTPPDSGEYDYTYLIGADSILLAYDTLLDFRGYAPGFYQVCGLSYKREDRDSFPQPDGSLSIDSLRRNLEGLEPIFCGEITENCVWVRIVPPPDTTFLAATICEGDSVMVGDSTLFGSGTYDVVLQNFAGCDSIVHLDLVVLPPQRTDLDLVICEGDSVLVGSQVYTSSGFYVDTLQAVTSCDSIVSLQLNVLVPIVLDTLVQLCEGQSFAVGDSLFAQAGSYEVLLVSDQGCDSLVRLELEVYDVSALIAAPDTLTCYDPIVILDGSASGPTGAALSYSWQDAQGQVLGNASSLPVSQGGAYRLVVTRTIGALQCSQADTVSVSTDIAPPLADAGLPDTLTCDITQLTVGGPNTSLGGDFAYAWSSAGGAFVGLQNAPTAEVNEPGLYQLVVLDQRNGCRDTSTVLILLDEAAPVAVASPTALLSCVQTSVQLSGAGSSVGPVFDYFWQSTEGVIPDNSMTLFPTVRLGGTYRLYVTNRDNGCVDSAMVVVGYDTLAPLASIMVPGILNCEQTSLRLEGSFQDAGPSPLFFWQALAGGSIIEDDNTLMPLIGTPGLYEFVVVNLMNGCRDTARAQVEQNVNAVQAEIGGGRRLDCTTTALTLDIGGSTAGADIQYLWSTADGNILGPVSGPAIQLDAPGEYQLVVFDALTRCADTSLAMITQDIAAPTADAGPLRTLTCRDSSVVLDGSNSSSGPDFDSDWILLNTLDFLASNTLTPTATEAGQYLLVITDTRNGCIDTAQVTVALDTLAPTVELASAALLSCDSLTVALDGSNSSQGADFDFAWSGPGLAVFPGLRAEASLPGLYTLLITNLDNGCTAADSIQITQDTIKPVANAGIAQILSCDSLTVQIGGAESSMGPGFAYAWSTLNGSFVDSPDLAFVRVDSAGDYQLVVINTLNGCRDTSTTFVVVDRDPPFTAAGPDRELTCGSPTALLDGSASETSFAIEHLWTGPCLVSGANGLQAVADCEGTYFLTSTNTLNGCIGIDSLIVSRDTLLPLAVLPDSAFLSCIDGRVILDGSASDGAFFEWYFEGQLVALDVTAIQASSPGWYALVAYNPVGDCADTAQVLVLLDCALLAAIAPPDTLTCARLTVELDATASIVAGNVTYQWIEPGPSCIAAGQGTPQLSVRCPGLYTLIIANPVLGLSDTATVEVFIDDQPPLADAGPSSTLTCDQPSATLDASGSSAGSHIGYQWTNVDETFFSTEISVEVNESGTYFLTVIDSLNGCIAEDIVVVQRSADLPAINFGAAVFPCFQDSFWLQSFVTPAGEPYAYSWEGGNILWAGDTSAVLLDTAGIVTLTVVNTSNNCPATRSVSVRGQTCVPCLDVAPFDSLTCIVEEVWLTAAFCDDCEGCTVQWTTQDGQFLSPTNGLEVLVGAPGTYTITATDTLGFSRVINLQVRRNVMPPPVEVGPAQQLDCRTPSVILGNGAFDSLLVYQWSWDGGALPPSTDTLPNLAVGQPGNYTLSVTNRITGCTAAETVAVSLDTLRPIAQAGLPLALTCQAPSGNLDGSASSFGLDIAYQWAGPPGAPIGGPASFNPLVNQPGWYFLTVTDNRNGCFAIDSVLVERQDELPPVPSFPDTALTCREPSILLSGTLPAPTGYRFCWQRLDAAGQPVGPCFEVLDIDISLPGTYRFELENEQTGCRNTALARVTEDFAPPSVNAGADQTLLCTLDSLMLSGVAGPLGVDLAYEWAALGGSPIANATTLAPTIFQPDTFRLRVTNLANGCSAADTVVVARDDNAPVAFAGPDTSLTCLRTSLRLRGEFQTASGAASLAWSSPDGQILLDGGTATPLIGQPGTYILMVTDLLNGCSAEDSVQVRNEILPPAAALVDSTLELNCRTAEILADASPSASATGAGLRFEWRQLPSTLLGNTPAITLSEATGYRLIVIDESNGCRDTLAFNVGSNFLRPTAVIAPPLPLTCARQSVSLDGSSSSAGANITYFWVGPAGDTLAATGPQATVDLPGLYRLTVIDENNGCEASAQRELPIDTLRPNILIRSAEALDCLVRTSILDATPSSSGGNFNYAWSTADGLLLEGETTLSALAGAPGWYVLAITNLTNGCVRTDSVEVLELASPIEGVVLRAESPSCPGLRDGTLRIDSTWGGSGPYLYAFDGGGFSTVVAFSNLPTGGYRLRVQDSNGCEYETLVVVPEAEGISVDLGPERTIRLGGADTLRAIVTPPSYDTLWWRPAEELAAPGAPEQVVSPQVSTLYTVWVRNERGCIASSQVWVKVLRENRVYAPNAFSPNGDGNNDLFLLYGGADIANIRVFRIFDRWGNMVHEATAFQPNDPAYGWDGNFNGTEMRTAVFVFYAEVEFVDGIVEIVQGEVLLMR